MVVTVLPAAAATGVTQERIGRPSICTVQAPHSAAPQPNLVPVMPSTSRSTQSSGVSPSTSMLCGLPLMLMVKAMYPLLFVANRELHHAASHAVSDQLNRPSDRR